MKYGPKPYRKGVAQKINTSANTKGNCDDCKTKIEKREDAIVLNPDNKNFSKTLCRACWFKRLE